MSDNAVFDFDIDALPEPPHKAMLVAVTQEMHSQNDRGAAITGGVVLEESLQVAIEHQWPPISNKTREKIFHGFGPLSSFSAKIVIAHAMGVLTDAGKADCDKIRRIRNEAAHLGTPFSFDAAPIAKIIESLRPLHDGLLDTKSESVLRNRFTASLKVLVAYLYLQENWKSRHGHNAVMPDFDFTE